MARIFLLKGDIANPGYVDIPEETTTPSMGSWNGSWVRTVP